MRASQHGSIAVCRIRPGEALRASCDFSSAGTNHVVRAGASHHDEMCNLYMMVSSELPYFMSCNGGIAAVSGRGAGGIPAPAHLEADRHAAWRPPQQASIQAFPLSEALALAGGVAPARHSEQAKPHAVAAGTWLVPLAQSTWTQTGTQPAVVLQQASLLLPHM